MTPLAIIALAFALKAVIADWNVYLDWKNTKCADAADLKQEEVNLNECTLGHSTDTLWSCNTFWNITVGVGGKDIDCYETCRDDCEKADMAQFNYLAVIALVVLLVYSLFTLYATFRKIHCEVVGEISDEEIEARPLIGVRNLDEDVGEESIGVIVSLIHHVSSGATYAIDSLSDASLSLHESASRFWQSHTAQPGYELVPTQEPSDRQPTNTKAYADL